MCPSQEHRAPQTLSSGSRGDYQKLLSASHRINIWLPLEPSRVQNEENLISKVIIVMSVVCSSTRGYTTTKRDRNARPQLLSRRAMPHSIRVFLKPSSQQHPEESIRMQDCGRDVGGRAKDDATLFGREVTVL